MENIYFENEYGNASLSLTDETFNIKGLLIADISPNFYLDIETVEKITLITENEKMCASFYFDQSTNSINPDMGVLFYYVTGNTVKIAKLESLNYTSEKIPQDELDFLVSLTMKY
jgi:hypothetical protein